MSAGSKTNPGGYFDEEESLEQFSTSDQRSPVEIAAMLRHKGYEPVWKDWDSSYHSHELIPGPSKYSVRGDKEKVLIAS